ncbi:MAG: hypothetical protein SFX74_13000 [Fimbriimonadaceae bacterium]|nr:hypothetical protein [Fimbriimonadaceae bacterium]
MQTPPPNYAQYPRYQAPRVRFDAIGEAFHLFGQQPGPYIVASLPALVLLLGSQAYAFAQGFGMEDRLGADFQTLMLAQLQTNSIGMVVGFIVALMTAGQVQMALRQIRGERVQAKHAFEFGPMVPSLALALLLVGFIVSLTMVACCLGVLFLGLFMLTFPLIVDQKMKALEAMRTSWDTIKTNLWPAAGLMFVTYLIYSISTGMCVGVVVGMPVVALVVSIVYRDFFMPQSGFTMAGAPGVGGPWPGGPSGPGSSGTTEGKRDL